MDTPPDPAAVVPTETLPDDDARTLPRGQAEDSLEAWLADQRWRAALESYSSLRSNPGPQPAVRNTAP